MLQKNEVNIQSLIHANEVNVDYSDEDIIIIDNVRYMPESDDSARLQMNVIVFCIAGRAQVEINGKIIEFHENQIFMCPPHVIFSGFMLSPDLEFRALFLTNRILQSFLREKISVWNNLLYIHKLQVVTLPPIEGEFLFHFYSMLQTCIDTPADALPYRTDIIQSLLRSAILGLCGWLQIMFSDDSSSSPDGDKKAAYPSSKQVLFQRFLNLLSRKQVKHCSISEYANELCITPKYLSSVCKLVSGKTANEWITDYVLEDVRYELLSTDHSMKEIADILGFPNSSFFGKFVKAHFGMSPKAYREQHPPII